MEAERPQGLLKGAGFWLDLMGLFFCLAGMEAADGTVTFAAGFMSEAAARTMALESFMADFRLTFEAITLLLTSEECRGRELVGSFTFDPEATMVGMQA